MDVKMAVFFPKHATVLEFLAGFKRNLWMCVCFFIRGMGWNCTVHFEVVTIWTDLCWSAEKVSTIEAGFASSRDGER